MGLNQFEGQSLQLIGKSTILKTAIVIYQGTIINECTVIGYRAGRRTGAVVHIRAPGIAIVQLAIVG